MPWITHAGVTPVVFVSQKQFDEVWTFNGWTVTSAPAGVDSPVPSSADLTDWTLAQAFRIISGTRNSNGALTSATITWPDGTAGTFTADTLSSAFPGAIDAYHVTYGSPTLRTITQGAVTRDSTTGAVTAMPALVIS